MCLLPALRVNSEKEDSYAVRVYGLERTVSSKTQSLTEEKDSSVEMSISM